MASHPGQNMYTFKATAAFGEFLAVKVGADNQHVSVASAATDKQIGISQNISAVAEDPVEVALAGGGAKAKLGGTVAAGDFLTSDAAGKLVVTTTNADHYVAQALEAGVLNDVIAVMVGPGII